MTQLNPPSRFSLTELMRVRKMARRIALSSTSTDSIVMPSN